MKSLKETLKGDMKKFKKNTGVKNKTNQIHRSAQWTDIDSFIECKSAIKKNQDLSIYQQMVQEIDSGFINQKFYDLSGLVYRLIGIYDHYSTRVEESTNEIRKLELIKSLIEKSKSSEIKEKKCVNIFLIDLAKYIEKKRRQDQKQKVEEFEQLVELIQPSGKSRFSKKYLLDNSSSGKNVQVKVTREEYEIKEIKEKKKEKANENEKKLRDFKSVEPEKKEKLLRNSKSQKSLDKKEGAQERLKQLMRDTSYKVIKTKVEYDFSAILQASRSNIRKRNKNLTMDNRVNEKDISTKLNKVKKNEGFVFYRPEKNQRRK